MMMSDLPDDLVEEILSKVSIKSFVEVRSTCKRWNDLSKDRILCKGEARQQFLGFMMKKSRVCSLRFDISGVQNEEDVFVEPSVKPIDKFNEVKIMQVFHCDGLLLLVTKEELVIWNPYLGQTRLIQSINSHDSEERYVLGYDKNHNHKILRYLNNYEIYDFKSNSWRVLDIIPYWYKDPHERNLSLKGNTYFFQRKEIIGEGGPNTCFLICFDFSRERFGPELPLPSQVTDFDSVALSSTREEQLAILYNNLNASEMEIWVLTKIEPKKVTWRKFLTLSINTRLIVGSFFIDKEKKLAVLFDISLSKSCIHVNGKSTEHLRIVYLGEAVPYHHLPVFSYAPSLVQINQGQ